MAEHNVLKNAFLLLNSSAGENAPAPQGHAKGGAQFFTECIFVLNIAAGRNTPAPQGHAQGGAECFKKGVFFKISRPEAIRQPSRGTLRAEHKFSWMGWMGWLAKACQSMPNCLEMLEKV